MINTNSPNKSKFELKQNSRNEINSLSTLLKSKSCLDKISYRISINKNTNINSKNNCTLKSIEQTTKEIKNMIESKLQTNFTNILNEQTRVCMIEPISLQNKEKQEATKKLMQDYWQKRQTSETQVKKKPKRQQKQNALPKIKTADGNSQDKQANIPKNVTKKKAIVSSFNIKMYEKQKQMQIQKKHNEQKILAYLYSYMVHIIDYKIQNDTPEFLLFQKINYTKWDAIDSVLKKIQIFCKKYDLRYCTLDLQKVMQLIDTKNKVEKVLKPSSSTPSFNITVSSNIISQKQFTPHQLLGCLQNNEEISANNQKKEGIRFYGNRGKLRAIIKIQAVWRGKIVFQKIKALIQKVKKIIKIQKAYRIYKEYLRTKQIIKQKCVQKYREFTQKQKKFKQSYRLNELTKKIKYEVHICCDSQSEWQRLSTQKFIQKQNCYLTRIFRAFKQGSAIETRIIYVSAFPIPTQILNYYCKLLELGGATEFKNRIIFTSPQSNLQLLDKVSLPRMLYYCPSVLRKIKNIIGNSYAYIVPSTPSIDYVHICNYLEIPIYSANPQTLLSLQTVSGSKGIIQNINKALSSSLVLPYAKNIYSLKYLVSELTVLILAHPHIWRWVLKIDNQFNARGLAYVEVNKLLPKRIVKFLRKTYTQCTPNSTKSTILPQFNGLTQEIYNLISQAFSDGERLTLVNKTAYRDQNQFLNFYFANGGIIQAEVNGSDQEVETQCFCVDIQPDEQWKFVCSFKKISIKKRTPCCYYDSQLFEPYDQIEQVVKQLIRKKVFGYFVLDFVKESGKEEDKNRKIYFNGIRCYLDCFSSAFFMRQFVSKQSNALYIPYIPHENIKKITMSTFFHLCRLQNISFDIQRKIGNIFMFLDGLESGCLGIMTFNHSSKIETFIHAAQVLDFFNSKVGNSPVSSPCEQFLIIRNAINGYLNLLRKKKNAIKSNFDIMKNSQRKQKRMMSYRQREYLQ